MGANDIGGGGQAVEGSLTRMDPRDEDMEVEGRDDSATSSEEDIDTSMMLRGIARQAMDVCGTAQDALLQTKENTQELQSILQRRRGGELGLADEIGDYLCFSPLDSSHEIVAMASMFTDLEAVAFSVSESLLSYISGLKVKLRPSGWSLVSKLMHKKCWVISFHVEKSLSGLY
ncbi:uncharacterized protein LOC131156072 [Malania oleifera]|uniref:uncharacterized protein LOC131156072 n=1 Tax=Malania oleifera TaxID=397392 RepID=UPI0025AE2D37|nr:uncharacterized protein LOC131156072 [Malania oleifera]